MLVALAGSIAAVLNRYRPPATTSTSSTATQNGSQSNDHPAERSARHLFLQRVSKLAQSNDSASRASNAGSAGSQTCARCHDSIAERYAQTGMGRSLSQTIADTPSPTATIAHNNSPRSYRVLRRNGTMWHQELLCSDAGPANDETPPGVGDEIVLSEYPVKWQIGSGHHSISYLVEIDGYLIESPVTWYTSRQAWGMSPGFEHPGQPGFARVADAGCLYCHAGDARPMDGSSHQLTIHEAAIGCERCHGPGQIHVERRDAELSNLNVLETERPVSDIDTSIVNPRHLDRELSDSICGQCHLRSAATVLVPGARLHDYRPGLKLADFRTDYRLEHAPIATAAASGLQDSVAASDESMTVVGHIEQLQNSRCYQQSDLSCVTCHDPHQRLEPEKQVEHYRAVCWQCHEQDDCHVPAAELHNRSPDNDCTVCHMPRSGTDIPHLTFTHHRIGLHSELPAGVNKAVQDPANLPPGTLVPLADSQSIPQPVKDAMLGLAYLEFSGRRDGLPHAEHYRGRAFQLLVEAWQQGERSPEVASALAALGTDARLPAFADFVRTASDQPELTASMRVNFLLGQAFWKADLNQFVQAAALMEKVVDIRRTPTDWQLLGDFCRATERTHQAAAAFEKSLQISPLNTAPRRWLIGYYEQTSDPEEAERHRHILSLIESWQRQNSTAR